ncbi:MAG TPA: response regulator transcription factor [Micromonosporaceae bacterium]|nr:response regulator transcription factor [Micromonosporaceae bacterium]
MVVRLFVADPSTMVRLGYATALAGNEDLTLAGAAGTAAEAADLVSVTRPDVVVVDEGLPDEGGLSLCRRVRADRPDVGLVLVGPADDELLFRALEERLSAYLPRSATVDVVLSAVRHAAVAPTAFTAPDLATSLARRQAATAALSPREMEVLRHVYAGASNARIAGSMRLTESTVRTYLARVYDKLGVRTRAEALVAAVERGLLR